MEASATLTNVGRTAMLGIVLLAAVCLASSAHPQGNPAAIEAMCANYARQSWPDEVRYNEYQRPRQQVYINCMMQHGLRP